MRANVEAIVVGGSAGALDALSAILPVLPHGFRIPIALVLHLPPSKPNYTPGLLRDKCVLDVREADDKEPILPGAIYLAPPDYHLFIEKQRCFSLSVDEPVHFSRPAIDVLFESAADAFGSALVGILLSGANEDGARGLARIKNAGGTAIVQTPATASSPNMPDAGIRLAGGDYVLSPGEIGSFIARLGSPVPQRLEIQ